MGSRGGQDRLGGLTVEEARQRLARDGPNEIPEARPRGLVQQVWDVMRQPIIALLLAAGALSFLLAEPADGLLLLLSVGGVVGITVFQQHRTERALTALRDLSAPRALVIRQGDAVRIPGREVVVGDVLVLSEGDRVPADGVLVEAVNLSVDEAILTGESVPVGKRVGSDDQSMGGPGGEGTPWVFSGTVVVGGHGVARARATGPATEMGRIGGAIAAIEPERTRLQDEVDRIVRVVAAVALTTAAAVAVAFALTRGDWLEGGLAGIASAMALLPEEFPIVLTVFLALGAWRLSRRHVLTRRSPAIEALGTVTVLCVDKTGTLTMNRMAVTDIVVAGTRHGVGQERLPDPAREVVEVGALACPTRPFDPMDRAFAERAWPQGAERGWELLREYPVTAQRLALCHVWRSPAGRRVVAVKGAPETVAGLCGIEASGRAELMARVEGLTAEGLRVLAVAAGTAAPGGLPADPGDFDLRLLGLAALRDPLRPGVAEAVEECRRAGVATVMVTGDYPGTAIAIARAAGIDVSAGCITGPEVEAMTDEELAARLGEVRVCARMAPEQKLRLVRALRADGHVVGMTGDGVNDAPALRAADIGIAMGGRGTDVAREAADLVITDDDFTSIVSGVRRGRGIFHNLRKAMAYIIAVHVPIFGMSLLPVLVVQWPLVLLPVQVAFLEFIIDPACSVAFEAEELDPRVMDESPRPRDEPLFGRRTVVIALLQGLSVLAAVAAVYLWAVAVDRTDDQVRSLAFVALITGNVALILVNRSWRISAWAALRRRRNRALLWILAGAGGLLLVVFAAPWLRDAFGLASVAPGEAAGAVVIAVSCIAWFEGYKWWRARRRC